jgi:hypothetical protein
MFGKPEIAPQPPVDGFLPVWLDQALRSEPLYRAVKRAGR